MAAHSVFKKGNTNMTSKDDHHREPVAPGNVSAAPRERASERFGMPRELSAPLYAAFERVFGRSWLDGGPVDNRVIELWRREDDLAALEIAAVGAALIDVERVDPEWVSELAEKIRADRSGGEHGWIFELIACGMLAAGGMPLRPAPNATSGYDAELTFEDGYRLRMSFKSFGISDDERDFHLRASGLRKRFRKLLPAGRPMRLGVQGRVHLQQPDFAAVAAKLAHPGTGKTGEVVPGRVAIVVRPLAQEPGELPFASGMVSDHCIIISPEHPKEQIRRMSRLRTACVNMTTHCPRAPGIGNLLLVRLHPTADIAQLFEKARQLLEQKEQGVDAIALYQPSVVRDSDGKSLLVHSMRVAAGPNFEGRGHALKFVALVGLVTSEPSHVQLMNGNQEVLKLQGNYVYQAGEIFQALKFDGQPAEGKLRTPAAGVHIKTLVEMNGDSFVLQGLFAPHDYLRLL